MFKKDKISFGFLIGCFAPVFGLLIFYFSKFYPIYSFRDFFASLKFQPEFITAIASLSLFVNAVFLTLYLNSKKDKTAIGIFIITFIYGLAALILKFFL